MKANFCDTAVPTHPNAPSTGGNRADHPRKHKVVSPFKSILVPSDCLSGWTNSLKAERKFFLVREVKGGLGGTDGFGVILFTIGPWSVPRSGNLVDL